MLLRQTQINNIDIKNLTYYCFDYIINIKFFDPNKIKTDENSYKKYSY